MSINKTLEHAKKYAEENKGEHLCYGSVKICILGKHLM